MKEQLEVLTKEKFPENDFFNHLERGMDFYWEQNYERALEEWIAASRKHYDEPVPLKNSKTIFFGSKIDILPVVYFFYTISSNLLTGMAVIKDKEHSCRLFFKKGYVVFANSSKTESRLGNFLLKQKDISLQQLENIVLKAKEENKRLGTFLVEKRIISRETLKDILSLQVQEIVSEVLNWQKGGYFFTDWEIGKSEIRHDPLDLLVLAARRKLTFSKFKELIPDNKVIFKFSPYIEEERLNILGKLNANERFIFSLIDGKRNIEQIINFSGGDETSVINILYYFLEQGWIRRTKEVVEYQDEEFAGLSKSLESLIFIFDIIYQGLFKQVGTKITDLLENSLKKMPVEYQKIIQASLVKDKIELPRFLKSFIQYFPDEEDRYVFVDIFQEVYLYFLEEGERFLGNWLVKGIVEDIAKTKTDIEKFYLQTETKEKLLRVLDVIVKRFC